MQTLQDPNRLQARVGLDVRPVSIALRCLQAFGAFRADHNRCEKWRAHIRLEPRFATNNKKETPNQTNLDEVSWC